MQPSTPSSISTDAMPRGVALHGSWQPSYANVLTPAAMEFVAELHRNFDGRRRTLLAARLERQAAFDAGELPTFPPETAQLRTSEWRARPAPSDLQNRKVEITGPVERKMMINALNSGAKVFMADLEDANSPTWDNCVQGQINLMDAVRRTLTYQHPDGREYRLHDQLATLVVRPRGLHLPEKHFTVDGNAVSGALFDFGLYTFHNARLLLADGSGPYFYLPKLETRFEAAWWSDVFRYAETRLGLPQSSIRATVLIETILAALEIDEIAYALSDYIVGMNAGRWDYIFSIIKKFHARPDFLLPDRAQVTMTVPFMRAYTERLVQICHRRGLHAIGGMAAFIPNRRDQNATARALEAVRADKLREARDGFDGSWVAHPDLVPVALDVFESTIGPAENQLHRQRTDIDITSAQLLDVRVPGGTITEDGLRNNISVALQYLTAWLQGSGAVAINNLMEDAATAEIARAQVWQWIHHRARTQDGRSITAELVQEHVNKVHQALINKTPDSRTTVERARTIFDQLVFNDVFQDFLTLPAYELLTG